MAPDMQTDQSASEATDTQLVAVNHPADAEPGNIVNGLPHDVTVANIGARLTLHAGWKVPHPTTAGAWVPRSVFQVFVAHGSAKNADGNEEIDPAVTSSDKKGDGKHVFHSAIVDAAKSAGLQVKCVCITREGAQLEFSK